MAWKSLTTKVTDDFKSEVDKIAAANGKTTSDFVRICIEDAVHGHYKLNGDHLVPTEEYLNALTAVVNQDEEVVDHGEMGDSEYYEFGFDTLVNLLRKKDYPDEYIKKMAENMISTAYDMPRFNPRRKRDDWGC